MPDFSAAKTYALFASDANKRLAAAIEKAGARLLRLPSVQFEAIDANDQTRRVFDDLFSFDWIVLTDVFAADYFLEILEKASVDVYELDRARVCAFGESVADRLRFAQIHADVIANRIDASEAFASLKNYEPDLTNKKFLIPIESNARPKIVDYLIDAGAIVDVAALYGACVEATENLPKLEALITGGAIDEFIFAAPAEIFMLARLFQTEVIARLIGDARVSAVDSTTSETLREFGFTKINLLR